MTEGENMTADKKKGKGNVLKRGRAWDSYTLPEASSEMEVQFSSQILFVNDASTKT
jgi:hypothetical protein